MADVTGKQLPAINSLLWNSNPSRFSSSLSTTKSPLSSVQNFFSLSKSVQKFITISFPEQYQVSIQYKWVSTSIGASFSLLNQIVETKSSLQVVITNPVQPQSKVWNKVLEYNYLSPSGLNIYAPDDAPKEEDGQQYWQLILR
eukprot:TRINITY_DN1767_c0_g1_i2.p2 TRINITY_DN1767_c0_g1~~TRINITY_DN1767_c0_g1_i2.p2  ORF type:complete len:143 (+),score=11.28 TRINITY_DN1767_c0_g1_i2:113-541(+)